MTTADQEIAAPDVQSGHAPKQTAIRVSRLSKRYGAVEAVRGIELAIGDGEIFGLIGPDGAGKTSTFQILAGVMEPSGGVAEIFGQPARAVRGRVLRDRARHVVHGDARLRREGEGPDARAGGEPRHRRLPMIALLLLRRAALRFAAALTAQRSPIRRASATPSPSREKTVSSVSRDRRRRSTMTCSASRPTTSRA